MKLPDLFHTLLVQRPTFLTHGVRTLAAGSILAGMAALANSQNLPSIYKGADLKQGEELIAEHNCTACHKQRVGGDGMSIYKPHGRITDASLLRGMVEQCNTSLNLQLFPEDVNSVAAVLNRDHYKFK